MRICTTLAALLVLALASPAHAAGFDVTVDNESLSFSPPTVRPAVGDTVTWHKTSGFHNVSSTTGMFRSGAATGEPFDYARIFSAGTFPYICEIHPNSMRGTVRVRPRVTPEPADET